MAQPMFVLGPIPSHYHVFKSKLKIFYILYKHTTDKFTTIYMRKLLTFSNLVSQAEVVSCPSKKGKIIPDIEDTLSLTKTC